MRYRSPAQREASRRNGSRSHGPLTPETKQRSAQNSRKHGLYAKGILLPGESQAAFDRLAAQLNARFQPADPVEAMLVQRMVLAQWRLIRIWSLEHSGMLQDVPNTPIQDSDPNPHPASRDLTAFHNLHGRANSGSILQLSEIRYSRQFDRAVTLLDRLRTMPKNENGETNPASNSIDGGMLDLPQPKTIRSRPARNPKPSQTEPAPTQRRNEPEPNKP